MSDSITMEKKIKKASAFICANAGEEVYTSAGKPVLLKSVLGEGGEGAVFITDCDAVAKIYRRDKLSPDKERKITALIQKKINHKGICFPIESIQNKDGHFIGFLMPKAKGKPLDSSIFISRRGFEEEHPDWSRKDIAKTIISILHGISFLHKNGILLGDINEGNILVESPDEVYFVDTDSFQFDNFTCDVGKEVFMPPELFSKDSDSEKGHNLIKQENENYSIAVLLFMMVMLGKTPYSQTDAGDVSYNIRNAIFPYPLYSFQIENCKIPRGPWKSLWFKLPFFIRTSFYSTFKKGCIHYNIHNRISVDSWLKLFKRYLIELSLIGSINKASLRIFSDNITEKTGLVNNRRLSGIFRKLISNKLYRKKIYIRIASLAVMACLVYGATHEMSADNLNALAGAESVTVVENADTVETVGTDESTSSTAATTSSADEMSLNAENSLSASETPVYPTLNDSISGINTVKYDEPQNVSASNVPNFESITGAGSVNYLGSNTSTVSVSKAENNSSGKTSQSSSVIQSPITQSNTAQSTGNQPQSDCAKTETAPKTEDISSIEDPSAIMDMEV